MSGARLKIASMTAALPVKAASCMMWYLPLMLRIFAPYSIRSFKNGRVCVGSRRTDQGREVSISHGIRRRWVVSLRTYKNSAGFLVPFFRIASALGSAPGSRYNFASSRLLARKMA